MSAERPLHIVAVVGARPNFMKVAPVLRAMKEAGGFRVTLVHTGQHYDATLSDQFFRDLEMPTPDVHLEVGSGSHAQQTARILERFEPTLDPKPDLVLVAGDVNSTAACALASVKLGIPAAHIEAGLRSGDRTMPEEVNRVITDAISDLLFTTSRDADLNLANEGIDPATVHFVGNTMIDTLRRFERAAESRPVLSDLELEPGGFALVTLHRPSNVDDANDLSRLVQLLSQLSDRLPIAFPIHPRTKKSLEGAALLGVLESNPRLHLLPPLGYLDFLALMRHARAVVTDSGGVQEETTALGVACFTLRPNTERPITMTDGTNLVVSDDPAVLLACLDRYLGGELQVTGRMPELWDGRSGERIADVLLAWQKRGMPARVRPRSAGFVPGH